MYVVNPDCKEARSVVSAEKLSHSIVPQLKSPSALKDKLEKNRSKFTDTSKQFLKYYDGHIKNLRENKVEESERKHLLESFIKYNDQQDKFRGKTTWRKLIPELETSITKYMSQS